MSQFVQLTHFESKTPLLVRVDIISYVGTDMEIRGENGGTTIVGVGNHELYVVESAKEVMELCFNESWEDLN